MNFNWGVFSLVAIFCWACVAYEIKSCTEPDLTRVSNAVADALYLAKRATKSLQEVMDSPDAIRKEALTLLDGFLGTSGITDVTQRSYFQFSLGES